MQIRTDHENSKKSSFKPTIFLNSTRNVSKNEGRKIALRNTVYMGTEALTCNAGVAVIFNAEACYKGY